MPRVPIVHRRADLFTSALGRGTAIAVLIALTSVALRGSLDGETTDAMIGVLLASVTCALCLDGLYQSENLLRLSFDYPFQLAEIFLLLYVPLPFLVLFVEDQLPVGHATQIAAIFLIGFLGFKTGYGWKRGKRTGISWTELLTANSSIAVMLFGVVAAFAVGDFYSTRIADGAFFTHAAYYEQDLSVNASLRDVLAQGLQIPALLILGIASISAENPYPRISKCITCCYALALTGVLVASSQTRPAITVMILSCGLYSTAPGRRVDWKRLGVLLIAGIAVVIFIQRVRRFSDEFEGADNQLTLALARSVEFVTDKADDNETKGIAISRAGGTVDFLGLLLDIDVARTPMFFSDMSEQLPSLVPRALWPSKPATTKMASGVLEHYGEPVFDAPLGPILEGFARFGWIGAGIELWAFGFLLHRLSRFRSPRWTIAKLFLFAFIFSYMIGFEESNSIGLAAQGKNAVVCIAAYGGLSFLVKCVRGEARSRRGVVEAFRPVPRGNAGSRLPMRRGAQ